MSARRDADVLVVGGGPAGASAAFQLARRGVDVLVLDRARFPRAKPCAECLSPEASRLLHDMGVLAELEPRAARLRGVLVRSPDGTEARGDYSAAHGYRAFRDYGLSIRRELLDDALLRSARSAGARVLEGARVLDVLRDATGAAFGVTVLGGDGATRELRAGLVVGADGLRSLVAHRLGLARTSAWPRRIAIVAHYFGVSGVGDLVELHVERDGFVGIADVGGSATTVAAVFPRRRAREFTRDPDAFLRRWLASTRLAPRFVSARPDGVARVTGPFASRARRAWAAGALLVGDAADFFDPFTGEGIYAGLRGGELAAHAALASLDAGANDRRADDAGREYEAARRREFGGKWRVEHLIGIGVASPAIMNRATRSLAARKPLADLLAGVTGDFVPARHVLHPGFLARLLLLPAPSAPAWR